MSTVLGDAAIRIALDPRAARAELEKLNKELDDIEKSKQEQEQDLKKVSDKAKAQGEAMKNAAGAMQGTRSGNGVIDQIKRTVQQVWGPIQTAATIGETLLPQLGTAIRSSAEGTMFEPYAKEIDAKIQQLADTISDVRTKVESALPTAQQAVEYNIAALRLGGRFPEDQNEVIKQIWQVTSAQENMRRNLNRDINNGTIESIFKAAKAFIAGGK